MNRTITPVPDLKQIAAFNIAVCLWNHIDDLPQAAWIKSRDTFELRTPHCCIIELSKNIPLPKSLIECIVEYTGKVRDEIVKWSRYHNRNIFFVEYNDYHMMSFFEYLVWRPDGTINPVQTALNLQNSIGLSELQKFRFLCLYCLEEQIEQKWKLLFEKNVFHTSPFNDFPLFYYWNRYCRRRLQDVPVTEGLSIDEFMFRHSGVDNWTAKEYFFNRLNADEQIQNAISVIDSDGAKYQESMIAKLNRSQRAVLFASNSIQIIRNYIGTSNKSNCILSTWHEISKVITADDFVNLLRELFSNYYNIYQRIVAEIWISASDEFKHHALIYNNDVFVQKLWNSWVVFYNNDVFQMLLDASLYIREEIKTMTVFNKHCEYLLLGGRIPMLKRTLNLCFRKSNEIASIKRDLARNVDCKYHFEGLVMRKDIAQLEQVLELFSDDVVVVNEVKESIVGKAFFNQHCKTLVEKGEISELDKLLNLVCSTKTEEMKQSIRDLFDFDFFIDHCRKLIIYNKIVELDQILNFFGFNVDESIQFKRSFIAKKFFGEHCQNLINCDDFSKLEKLFKSFFPHVEELVQFKQSFSKKKVFVDGCLNLIIDNELSTLDQLLKIFFPKDEESERFKEDLTRKKVFLDHCQNLILDHALNKLTILLNTLYFPCFEKTIKFKQELAGKKIFYKQYRKLIESNELSKLDELLNSFYPSFKELAAFKKDLVGTKMFANFCQTMIEANDFINLEALLVWTFPVNRELTRFKQDLVESKPVKERCLNFLTLEDSDGLDDLLNFTFAPHFELVHEYKRNLLLSEKGIEICFILINRPNTVLEDMIVKCLPTSTTVIDFKKHMIFSPAAISQLKKASKNSLIDVKKFIDWFLESSEDKNMLKMQLINDSSELITMLFFESDKSSCRSNINWLLPDKAAIQECKRKIPVDEVFEAGLKKCVFRTSDSYGRASRCVLKNNFDLGSLDRFLRWYFETSKKIKEYKIQRFKAYEAIETINLMLKKGCKSSYFNELSNWFFDNDAVEMAKFKKKHKGEKIAGMMNNSRNSYFKS